MSIKPVNEERARYELWKRDYFGGMDRKMDEAAWSAWQYLTQRETAPVAPATECPVCAKRQKFSIAVLPKITAEIISEFGEVSLIEYDKAGEAQWTQDAVDFAALVAGHLTCPIGSEFDKPIGWKFKYKESDDWSYTENAKAAKRYREREYFVQAVYDRKPAPVADAPAEKK